MALPHKLGVLILLGSVLSNQPGDTVPDKNESTPIDSISYQPGTTVPDTNESGPQPAPTDPISKAIQSAIIQLPQILQETNDFRKSVIILKKIMTAVKEADATMKAAKDSSAGVRILGEKLSPLGFNIPAGHPGNISVGTEAKQNAPFVWTSNYNELINNINDFTELYEFLVATYDKMVVRGKSFEVPLKKEDLVTQANVDSFLALIKTLNLTSTDPLMTSISEFTATHPPALTLLINSISAAVSAPSVFHKKSLLPQEKINGGNLFTNTVYKLHVVDEEGCFVTYNFSGAIIAGHLVVRCNWTEADKKIYESNDSSFIFQANTSSLKEFTISNLVHKSLPLVVTSDILTSYLFINWPSLPHFLLNTPLFEIRIADGEIALWTVKGTIFYKRNTGTVQPLALSLLIPDPPLYFARFVPIPQMELTATYTHFEFTLATQEELDKHTSKKKMMDSYEIINSAETPINKTASASTTVTEVVSWGLSAGALYHIKTNAEITIPFEESLEVNFKNNFDGEKQQVKKLEISKEVTVPPHTTVTVSSSHDLIKDLTIQYTAQVEITGVGPRVSIANEIVENQALSSDFLRGYVEYIRFEGKLIKTTDTSLVFEVRGEMTVTTGLRGQLAIDENPIATNM